jgi:hypothetical protein
MLTLLQGTHFDQHFDKGETGGKCFHTLILSFFIPAMADFQYLPFKKTESGYENISHQFHLYQNVDRNEYLARESTLFLPPVIFSRFDIPDKDYNLH